MAISIIVALLGGMGESCEAYAPRAHQLDVDIAIAAGGQASMIVLDVFPPYEGIQRSQVRSHRLAQRVVLVAPRGQWEEGAPPPHPLAPSQCA